jgi:hypothetical protein
MFVGQLPMRAGQHMSRRLRRPDRPEFWLANRLAAMAALAALGGLVALAAIPALALLSHVTGI